MRTTCCSGKASVEEQLSDGPGTRLNASNLDALRTLHEAGAPLKSGDWRARIGERRGKGVPEKTFQNWRSDLYVGEYITANAQGSYELTQNGLAAIGMPNQEQKQAA